MFELTTFKSLVLITPVVGLILLGLWLTLGSGLMATARGGTFRIACVNLGRMLLLLAAYAAALALVQQVIGSPWRS